MTLLAGLAPEQGVQEDVDRLGGFSVLDTDAYKMVIKAAYISKSAGGAMALNVHFADAHGAQLRQSFWMTSGTAKGGKTFYISKKDGSKHYLPGYNNANALCLLTVGQEISTLTTEKKHMNLYDSTAQKEVPTEVDMLMPIIGKEIYLGVVKQVVDKNEKDPATGAYVPTGETRDENDIAKVFRATDQLTVMEIKGGIKEAGFFPKWVEKMKGTVINKAKGTGAVAGAPKAIAGDAAPKTNLFA